MSKVMDILEQVGVIPVVVIENENDAIPLIKAMKILILLSAQVL